MKSSVLKCGELRGCRSGEERKGKTEEEKGAQEKKRKIKCEKASI